MLIAKFKHDFLEGLDWLDIFSEDKVAEFEKYQTQLPEIEDYKLLKKPRFWNQWTGVSCY